MTKRSTRRIFSLDEFEPAIKRLDQDIGSQESSALRSHNPAALKEARRKRKLLRSLQDEHRSTIKPTKSLFISYPDRMQAQAEFIKHVALDQFDFKAVFTGFDADVRNAKSLRTGIIFKIAQASCFLGIWNDDIEIKLPRRREKFVGPGVWMPIELGMALALDKPVRLLLRKGLHSKLVDPVNDFPHFWFDDERSFERSAGEALTALSGLLDNTEVGREEYRA